jgi:hypothetical protein
LWILLAVGRVRVAARITDLSIALWVRHTTSSVLGRNLAICRSVADGRELRADAGRIRSRGPLRIALLAIDLVRLGILAVALLGSLASILFLLLPGLPFFSDLLEFCNATP